VRAKVLITFRGAISTDDVNLRVRAADSPRDIRQNIEKPGIEMMDLAGAVVAEELVELRQGFGNVGIPVSINDVQMFSRMRVVEPEMALL